MSLWIYAKPAPCGGVACWTFHPRLTATDARPEKNKRVVLYKEPWRNRTVLLVSGCRLVERMAKFYQKRGGGVKASCRKEHHNLFAKRIFSSAAIWYNLVHENFVYSGFPCRGRFIGGGACRRVAAVFGEAAIMVETRAHHTTATAESVIDTAREIGLLMIFR